jgi:ribonucleotide monophosphatase NagD (HAD superfamily)
MLLLLPLPQVNVGKGGDWLFDHLMQRYQIQPSRTAMIGDRLDTDIAMGKQGGLMTLLPLTGELVGLSGLSFNQSLLHLQHCDSWSTHCQPPITKHLI